MFSNTTNKRIKLIELSIIFGFILIICKIFYIEVFDYKKLNKYAYKLWNRNIPIGADRGKIITSDNVVVADNETRVSLIFIPNQIKEDKDVIAAHISKILECNKNDIYKYLVKTSMIERPHPIGRRLTYDKAEKIKQLGYKGIYLVRESKRIYPYKNMLSHTLGYVGIDNQGLSGLELKYDNYLKGEEGSISYLSDAKGNNLELGENYIEPNNGFNIELTINYNIQKTIERELSNAIIKYNADGAWAIMINPNTGEILGLSSYPSFDANNYQNYQTEVINRNMPIWATYEPGSTFKNIHTIL